MTGIDMKYDYDKLKINYYYNRLYV